MLVFAHLSIQGSIMKSLSSAVKAALFLATLSPVIAIAKTTLITNIQGYTINGQNLESFSAIAFTDDKIDKIYSAKDALPSSNKITIIDGEGKTLIPGLIDSHGHILSYGLSFLRADLVNTFLNSRFGLNGLMDMQVGPIQQQWLWRVSLKTLCLLMAVK